MWHPVKAGNYFIVIYPKKVKCDDNSGTKWKRKSSFELCGILILKKHPIIKIGINSINLHSVTSDQP